ncbi:ABC transporter ATP-binding protein [Legionella sp. W05-934-2]|jgi:putative ABC transport system ATP-binding protein|uniref:ABC transporter ATP-binding protein n=1 Tax=Legionella sp. W05-934-2 TaxID=1198649 RepID=UPI003461A620
MEMVEPVIHLHQLIKQYHLGSQTIDVLKGIDLLIQPGEMVAIIGASGSGKSTLMNIIGLLDRPTSGVYQLQGTDVSHLTDDACASLRNQQIGFVFQQFNLLPRLTAEENVALPLVYAQVPLAEQRARVKDALTNVDMYQYAHHRPSQLSGGQQQRVAIARALVNKPSIILADEPTGALDSKTSAEVMQLFHQLNGQGCTVVIITHDPSVAQQCQRIIRISDGCISPGGHG